MNTLFWDCALELRLYRANNSSSKILPNLNTLLSRFEKKLLKCSDIEIDLFIDENTIELKHMKALLLEKKNPLTSFHDKIFKNILKFNENKDFVNIPNIFRDFVKGITYSNETPIYHRLYSCGEKGSAFYDQLHKCTDQMDSIKRRETEKRIYNCYLERLIYDNIYLHIKHFFPQKGDEEHTQDTRHVERLEKTKLDFQSCFPKITLDIEIGYKGIYPESLKILKSVNNKLHYKEIFVKEFSTQAGEIYTNVIKCILHKSNGIHLTFRTYEISKPYKKLEKDNDTFVDVILPSLQLSLY